VAAETSSIAEMRAPAKMVAVSRAEVKMLDIDIPLDCSSDPTIGPRHNQCTGRANSRLSLFFSVRWPMRVNLYRASRQQLGNFPNQLEVVLPPSGCNT
jgi:hypothetical protein